MHSASRSLPAGLLVALMLAGCATAPGPAAPPAPPPPPVVAPQLALEQQWLEDLFKGTPVAIGPGSAGELRVEVPLKYSFDPGKPAVKPALGAVLDKVAISLARQKRARLQLAGPSPETIETLRSQMAARGVALHRIDRLPPRADAVELRLLAPPPPVERLEDPPPAAARRPSG